MVYSSLFVVIVAGSGSYSQGSREPLICEENSLQVHVSLLAEEEGEYVVWLYNDDEGRSARVKLHFLGWEAQNDDE